MDTVGLKEEGEEEKEREGEGGGCTELPRCCTEGLNCGARTNFAYCIFCRSDCTYQSTEGILT